MTEPDSITVYTPRDHTPLALLTPKEPRLFPFPSNLEVLTKSPGRNFVVVTVHIGRCHVDAGMNALVVSSQQLR